MSSELLDTAELLVSRSGGPTPTDACRAVSTIYYALFHCLAKSCCDLFVGADRSARPQRAWDHLYRSLSHGVIDERCGKIQRMTQKGFHQNIIDFAEFIRNMQWERERCDYTFGLSPNINATKNDIALARGHIGKFQSVPENHRRAFAVYLLVREDRHEKKVISV